MTVVGIWNPDGMMTNIVMETGQSHHSLIGKRYQSN